MPRERDPRTGRFISSRENTREPTGPSVPGAFDEPTDTRETSETVERIESDEMIDDREDPAGDTGGTRAN
jgi:hypothetical protein